MVNTFAELEPYAIKSVIDGSTPPVYCVGPVLDLKGQAHEQSKPSQHERIMRWLDGQPDSSVVFLCFGSVGAFREPQVKEIATGLEASGVRFLWSLRKPPSWSRIEKPREYTDNELKDILPGNFLSVLENERRGLVCGWAPQVEVLAHKAVGAFVSHCGWNSTLESLWFGVPIVTWPLYAEQHTNALQLVKELGLAVELRMDYRMERGDIVMGYELQRALRCVMDHDNPVRKEVKEIAEVCRRALMDGGSSLEAMECLTRDIAENLED